VRRPPQCDIAERRCGTTSVTWQAGEVRVVVLANEELAARYMSDWVSRRIARVIAARGEASVAFSGGSTPARMIDCLARETVRWKRVRIFQMDERITPTSDPARNLHLLRRLPVHRGQVVDMSVTLPSLDMAVRKYEQWLPARLDIAHLGLGDDGHTASWPPGAITHAAPGRVTVTDAPFNGYRRMTLTARYVNDARWRVVHVVGAAKAEVVSKWVRGDDHDLPIHHLKITETTVVLDEAAASALPADTTIHRPRWRGFGDVAVPQRNTQSKAGHP
jgi:6-phosphogluconolactonase/glucosamine-6-phosphate isomerase/deaminase